MLIYKLLSHAEWREALAAGVFAGSAADRADGFIHFSTAAQLAQTARKHFRGRSDLMLFAVSADALGDTLRWEASRGGDLFPHLYDALACSLIVTSRRAPLAADGEHDLGTLTE